MDRVRVRVRVRVRAWAWARARPCSMSMPAGAKAVKWAALGAASSSTRGSGWAPIGLVSPLGAPG
eukprot:scaffold102294_cov18-Phaeocystis_antarctica.AAC.1